MPFSLPPPLEAALIALSVRMQQAAIDWVVCGSTARALAGFTVVPNDLDIEVDEGATHAAATCLDLVEHVERDGRISSVRARGEWHGVPVDINGGLTFHGPGGHLHADFPMMRLFAAPVELEGRTIWVAPVEEQIVRSIVAGAEDRLDRIADERPASFRMDDVYLSLRLAAASASR